MTLRVENLGVWIGDRELFRPLSFAISNTEVLTVMGASGSGKSSLLSAIAGDLPSAMKSSGQIYLNDRALTFERPERRRIGRLFQDDLLFPHLTVGENLLFGMPRGNALEREAKMQAALNLIELSGFSDRSPHTLSGGQRARVALMRTLLAEPDAVLLDEPFSKLDADLRQSMRNLTFQHLHERAIPALLVTHDREDVPNGGRIIHV